MDKNIELKPCPFCGNRTAIRVHDENESAGYTTFDYEYIETPYFLAVCSMDFGGCGAASGYKKFPDIAAEAWNKRIGESEEKSK